MDKTLNEYVCLVFTLFRIKIIPTIYIFERTILYYYLVYK